MKQFKFKAVVWFSAVVLGLAASVRGAEEKPQPEQFVFVEGEVRNPGPKIFTNGMTTLDAIRMAKGVTDEASATNIVIKTANQKSVVLNRLDIEAGKKADLKLHAGDKIIVPHK